jgi:ubiquinone/menaquinone biosynthesis C-methylase UbiE
VARIEERSRRHGVGIEAFVAQVQRLPFADRSFDLVYVHDGLHHLEDPAAGLAEMARVARVAVSVTEPARAAITRAAVGLRLAMDREPAGNRVARLTCEEVAAALTDAGFVVVRSKRYLMKYAHEPGRIMSLLSQRAVLPAARAGFAAVNAIGGRAGNKLTVQAVRVTG